MLQENDIYLVRRKADNTFEELGESPFQYTGAAGDAFSTREFSIKTKLRVPELLVEGTHTILDTDTQTSEQLLITNDGTGPAVVINQKGQEAILDVQDDDVSVLYIRGDNPHGGNVGIGMGRGPIVSSGSFVEGKTYTIASVNDGAGGGDTNFTVFGSPSNAIGEVFVAGPGAQGGTGTANLTILPAEQLELTKNMLLANDTSIFFRDTGDSHGVVNAASISYTDDDRLVISNPQGEGVELSTTLDGNVQVKVDAAGGVTLGKVNPDYENSGSHVEVSGDAKVNLMLTHRNESISGKLDINGTTNTLDIGTTTAHDLTLGTRNVAFFTLDQYGHAFLKQANPGSGLTGGDLTIDGKLSLGGDMLSIAGEEVLYSDYIHVTGTPKEYKILEFTYPTEIDDDNEATGDEGSAFIIEVWSDYQNAGEYVKYSLCHTFLDTANDGSTTGGDLDDPGSRDYALKILESHSVPNAGSFRIRLPKAGDGDIGDSDKNTSTSFDIAVLPVFLDLKNYAGVRVKITSLSSGTKRIATDVNWSDSDEYRFWSAPTGVEINPAAAWNDNTPNTEPGDALFADTFYGSRNVNWLGTESGYSPYYLKPADTGTSMVVAGNVGIGTDLPGSLLTVSASKPRIQLHDNNNADKSWFFVGDGGAPNDGAFYITSGDDDYTNLSTRFCINHASGNVGIGTPTPGAMAKLHILGTSSQTDPVNHALGNFEALIENDDTTVDNFAKLHLRAGTADSFIMGRNKGLNSSEIAFYTDEQPAGSLQRMVIDSTGNVGIGTDSPLAKLQVESPNSTAYSSSHMPTISNVTGCFRNAYSGGIVEGTHTGLQLNVAGNKDGSIDTTPSNVDNQNVLGYVGIVAEEDMTNAGALVFHSSPGMVDGVGAASRPESMRITSTGKVGIGTISPDRDLTVAGNFRLEKTTVDGGDVALDFNSGGAADHPELNIYDKDGHGKVGIGAEGLKLINPLPAAVNNSNDPPAILFQANGWDTNAGSEEYRAKIRVKGGYSGAAGRGNTHPVIHFDLETNEDNPDDALSTKMVISADGNVGIGTDNPDFNLDLGSDTSGEQVIRLRRGATDINQWCELGYRSITTHSANTLANNQTPFFIDQEGSDGTRRAITVDAGGNVGIGTTSPSSNHNRSLSVEIRAPHNDAGSMPGLRLTGNETPGGVETTSWETWLAGSGGSGSKLMISSTRVSGAGVATTDDRLTIDHTGNVKIGTPGTGLAAGAGTAKLLVYGDIETRGYIPSGVTQHGTATVLTLDYSSSAKKEYSGVHYFEQPSGGTYYFHLIFDNNLQGTHYRLRIIGTRLDHASYDARTINRGSILDESFLYFESDGEQGNNPPDTYREPLMEAATGVLTLGEVTSYVSDSFDHAGPLKHGSSPYDFAIVRYPITLPGPYVDSGGTPHAKFYVHLEVFGNTPNDAEPPQFKFVSGP